MVRSARRSFVIFFALIAMGVFVIVSLTNIAYAATYNNNQATCEARGGTFTAGTKGNNTCKIGTGTIYADSVTTDDKIKSLLFYRAIGHCFTNVTVGDGSGTINKIDDSWWPGGGGTRVNPGPYLINSGLGLDAKGGYSCSDIGALSKAARGLWGIDSDAWLCAAGWLRLNVMNDSSVNNSAPLAAKRCLNADGVSGPFAYYIYNPSGDGDDYEFDRNSADTIHSGAAPESTLGVIKDRVYGGGEPSFSDEMIYPFYLETFFNSCASGQDWQNGGSLEKPKTTLSNEFSVSIVALDGSGPVTKWFQYAKGYNAGTNVITREGNWPKFNDVVKTCGDMVGYLNDTDNVDAYNLSVVNDIKNGKKVGTDDSACALASGATDSSKCTSDTAKTSCVIDGVGWIVCAAAVFVAQVSDAIYGLIEQMISVPAINTDTSSGSNGVYNTWQVMRSFANVMFVIAFIIIIFSQLTGVGITNYGVKKTLPRLIVAAILVNVSFWIAAVAVDASNILGAGLYDLITSIRGQMNISLGDNPAQWVNIINALLGGAAITMTTAGIVGVSAIALASLPGVGMALLFLALPIVLAALLAVFIVIFILVARQALVIILIIISPLAFVALLLPNTENLFKKWRQWLTTLLLMYPIVSIVFAGAQIAGLAIMSTAGNTTNVSPTSAVAVGIAIVTGQLVMVAPFFFLPTILTKFSGGNLDKVAASIKSKGNKLLGGVSGMSRKFGMRALNRSWNRAKYGPNSGPKFNRRGKEKLSSSIAGIASSAGRTFDQYQDRQGMTDEYLADQRKVATRGRLADPKYATAAAAGDVAAGQRMADRARATAEAEELKKALEPLVREIAQVRAQGGDVDGFLSTRAKTASGAEAAAAVHQLAALGRDKELRGLDTHFKTSGNADMTRRLQEAIQANAGTLVGKAPDLVKGAAAAFKTPTGEQVASYSAGTATEQVTHLEGLFQVASAAGATQADKDAFNGAMASFQASIKDIHDNPMLQAKFSGDAGKAMLDAFSASSIPGFQAYSPSSIDKPTGKIR